MAILTGPIGAGKTTAAAAVCDRLRDFGWRIGGFLSPAIRDAGGSKIGIEVVRLATREVRQLALIGGSLGGPEVGPYSFSQSAIDWAIRAYREDSSSGMDVLCCDELGRLEFERGSGFAALIGDLGGRRYVNALAIVRMGHEHSVLSLDSDVDVAIFTVEPNQVSRESTPIAIGDWLLGIEANRSTRDGRGQHRFAEDSLFGQCSIEEDT